MLSTPLYARACWKESARRRGPRLKHVAERVTALHKQHGHYWEPSDLLLDLAQSNSSFAEFDRAAQNTGAEYAAV
jgi:hypothetical protein